MRMGFTVQKKVRKEEMKGRYSVGGLEREKEGVEMKRLGTGNGSGSAGGGVVGGTPR